MKKITALEFFCWGGYDVFRGMMVESYMLLVLSSSRYISKGSIHTRVHMRR